ncbi:hypothetical protein E2C01_007582 [Portunus trituberculatus]|uniref:Uncharacterized protein n=1 Tax=Portunus trituberculatus TaxID=210409 RepID=A0A5B7D2S9_PORTR|nr:hypothetical protein [Portunus trituberculatus]
MTAVLKKKKKTIKRHDNKSFCILCYPTPEEQGGSVTQCGALVSHVSHGSQLLHGATRAARRTQQGPHFHLLPRCSLLPSASLRSLRHVEQ